MTNRSPFRVAVLGAGPIGLETALAAREAGFDVQVFERGRVAENVLRWGHVRMFSPFGMNRSALGLQALSAENAAYVPPPGDALLTGRQWAEDYLIPLARSAPLREVVRQHTAVASISRRDRLKTELPGSRDRARTPFRLLLRGQDGRESIEEAEVVVDATGVFPFPNWLGDGGGPAIGEASLQGQIEHELPNLLEGERDRYAGRRVLLIGSGYSAATSSIALARLAELEPETKVTWLTRRSQAGGPIRRIENDRLPERDRIARSANALAAGESGAIEHRVGVVERIEEDGSAGVFVQLRESMARLGPFDRIVANVGYRPQRSLHEELQVHECYATGGPMRLAAALLGNASADCLDQTSHGPETLVNPEPNFFILGARSYGRNSNFLVSTGLAQIEDFIMLLTQL